MTEISDLAAARAIEIAQHYQRTSELVSYEWRRRNRQSIIIFVVLAVTALVPFFKEIIPDALLAFAQSRLPNLKPEAVELLKLTSKLVTAFLLGLLVVPIFYLMAVLCHRSGMIINLYLYLSMMEQELRKELQIPADYVAFTREGPFYAVTGSGLTKLLGFCHKTVLGFLLAFFFASQIFFELPTEWVSLRVSGQEDALRWYGWLLTNYLFVVKVLVAAPTFWLFIRYARLRSPSEADVRAGLMRAQGGA